MTALHQSSSTINTEKNLRNVNGESSSKSGMVAIENTSKEVKNEEARIEEWCEETRSISSRNSSSEDEDSETGQEIVATDDCVGNFGNIVVKNSSDVQFGNNTYYQGPVTIKQFLYNNGESDKLALENGKDNSSFQPETVISNDVNYAENFKNVELSVPSHNSKKPVPNEGSHWLNYIYKKRKLYSICLSSILTVLLILLIVLLVNKYNKISEPLGEYVDSDEQENSIPVPPPSGNTTLSGKLKIIPRFEWLAQPPENKINDLHTPVPFVVILHTASDNCSDQARCSALVRYIQNFHIEGRGWSDIGYNFLVGGDGYAYEGRGWKQEGAHTLGYNSRSIGIAFMGTFNKIPAPERQILACKLLIAKGVKEGAISKNYKLFAHRQLSSTQSPGEVLYQNIKTWPHWAESPD